MLNVTSGALPGRHFQTVHSKGGSLVPREMAVWDESKLIPFDRRRGSLNFG